MWTVMDDDDNLFLKRILNIHENLYNFAYMLNQDMESAKGMMHDTNLNSIGDCAKYLDNIYFKEWLFIVMRNIVVNSYHKRGEAKPVIDQDEEFYYLNLPQDSAFDTPDRCYSLKELSKAIESLSIEYRIPFSMYLIGYKYHEIAAYMKLPLGTVKGRIFFTRQKIQLILNGEE